MMGGCSSDPVDAAGEAERGFTSSVVAGLGKGLVGMVTKPLGGAAHLLASTGQGLLQAAGWGPKIKVATSKLPSIETNLLKLLKSIF